MADNDRLAIVSSTIDQFLADHSSATLQDLFQTNNVVDLLTIHRLLNSAQNGVIRRV